MTANSSHLHQHSIPFIKGTLKETQPFYQLKKFRKLFYIICIDTVFALNGYAICSQTATRTASSFSNDASNGGARAWSNPSNAGASDNSRATAGALILGQITHYLRAENFGFSIPATAIICGFEITIEKSASGLFQNVVDNEVKIIKNGAISGTNLGFDDVWGTSDAMAIHGNTNETCGLAWTPATINAANFGAAISVNLGGLAVLPTARIDYISITVYYTYSPLPIQLLNFTAQCFKTGIQLHWASASEQNNAEYIIQASVDGSNWTGLDSLPGAGTTDIIQNYNWMDSTPSAQLCYYRLCQRDYDGTEHCFVPLAIRNNCFAESDEMLIYPNPVQENVCFRYTAREGIETFIQVINQEGQVVFGITEQMDKGYNNHCYSTASFKTGGYYFLKIMSNKNTVTARFFK